ncbi:hypothetical protein QWY85_02895 [Neolewinella lacunae]|uniref:Uncharacterized protein n=1 Tax=Neolewinella lacunae TaxID=1517758 RepID=A0A923PQ24_9BACT|nr:hypothetical protein [Neolewinella lacunae]MBC6996470.1 hypothetical protein [Neolewinella lacunae]MDN3633587.1 hypothetical protein [Neolewinella lacunae]
MILANLDLSESDPKILKRAFEITGNGQEFTDTYGSIESGKKICLLNRDDWTIIVCEDDGGGTGGGGGSPFITNECGCQIFANQRKPGGTIKVEDTQFNQDFPVRRVRVVAKNGWFTWRRTDTDDNGCWRVDKEFSGRAWFWVKFKDTVTDRVKIRFSGIRGLRFWQKAFTGSVYLGRLNGPNFHNISTRFGRWNGQEVGTKVHYSWAGATVNNALHEFHDFSSQEGFIPPPDNINMMVNLKRTGGFATMLRQMGSQDFITAVNQGVGFWAPNAIGFTLNDNIGQVLVDATQSLSWPQSSPLLNTFLGDVNTGGDFRNSDRMKRLAYHEIGHASHFAGSSTSFYRSIIAAEVGAFGHGNPNVNLAGHIQIAESWAQHMALTMVKLQYPPSVGNTSVVLSWELEHEDVRNEKENHIPIGIFNDLIDGINLSENVYDEDDFILDSNGFIVSVPRTPLRDNVTGGYTNQFFAQTMNSSVFTPDILRQRCISSLPVNVTTADVNDLFSEYNN